MFGDGLISTIGTWYCSRVSLEVSDNIDRRAAQKATQTAQPCLLDLEHARITAYIAVHCAQAHFYCRI
jgi:hypothetical protein